MKRLLLAISMLFVIVSLQAKEAVPVAADPATEKRMIALTENLRCLVCQNESLAASQAELALDLKQEIREMMKKGESDKQIVDYLVHRYGDFVLYKPPVKSTTLLLWFGPFIFLVLGLAALYFTIQKRRSQVDETSLSRDEEQRANSLLEQNQ